MIYRDFQGLSLSALGFGTMRLPVVNGEYKAIDEKAAAEMIDYAMRHGVNYYDTAWGYHDGESERAVGKNFEKLSEGELLSGDKIPRLRSFQYE